MSDLGITAAPVVDATPVAPAKRTRRAARTRPSARRTALPKRAAAPVEPTVDRQLLEWDRRGSIIGTESWRHKIIEAIGAINHVIGNRRRTRDEEGELERAEARDPEGRAALEQARGHLLRALASPGSREFERQAVEHPDDLPGQFYMPDRSAWALGVAGLEPHEMDLSMGMGLAAGQAVR